MYSILPKVAGMTEAVCKTGGATILNKPKSGKAGGAIQGNTKISKS